MLVRCSDEGPAAAAAVLRWGKRQRARVRQMDVPEEAEMFVDMRAQGIEDRGRMIDRPVRSLPALVI